MSSPSPVVVQFVVKGMEDVLKAMKTIQEASTGSERKSTAAKKAGASARKSETDKEVQEHLKAMTYMELTAKRAEIMGTGTVKQQVQERIKLREKSATMAGQQAKKEADAEKAQGDKVAAYWKTLHKKSADYRQTQENKQLSDVEKAEKGAADAVSSYWKNLHKKSADYRQTQENKQLNDVEKAEKAAADRVSNYWKNAHQKSIAHREGSASSASAGLADRQSQVARAFRVEENRARLELRRRGVAAADPANSPHARLQLLRGAEGKTDAEREHILGQVASMRQKAAVDRQNNGDAAKKARKDEVDKTREFEKGERDRLRVSNSMERARNAVRDMNRKVEEKAEDESRKKREQFNKTVLGAGGRAASTVGSITHSAVRNILQTGAGLGGGLSIEGALQERLDLDRASHRLAVATNIPGQESVSAQQVMSTVRATSTKTGVDQQDLLAGLQGYTDRSGDYKGGARNLELFGKVSKLTGTSVKEIMETAGTWEVQNKALGKDGVGPEMMKDLLLSTVMQGRQGTVDFDSLARAGAKVTRTSSRYSGDMLTNQKDQLGLLQVGMKTGSKDPAETATAIANFSSDLINHHGAAKALLGHGVLDEHGDIKGTASSVSLDLYEAAMHKTGGKTQLSNIGGEGGKAFFGQRSRKLFDAYGSIFKDAMNEDGAKGLDEKGKLDYGIKRVREETNKAISTTYTEKDVDKDYGEVMKSASEQFEGAVKELKNALADELLPPLTQLAVHLREMMPEITGVIHSFGLLARVLSDNPLPAVIALVAVQMSRIVGGLNSNLSGASLGVAGLAVALAAGIAAIDAMSKKESDRQTKGVGDQIGGANLLSYARPGAIKSKEDLAKVKAGAEDLKKSIAQQRGEAGGSSTYLRTAQVGAGLIDGATFGVFGAQKKVKEAHDSTKSMDDARVADMEKTLAKLTKAIEKAATEIDKKGGGEGGGNPPAGSNPAQHLPLGERH